MDLGIRTQELRKIYTTTQPFASISTGSPGLGKSRRQDVIALDGVTLDIRPGEIFGLLGPNGAGKSTMVGILTTRVRPTSGEVWIGDLQLWRNLVAAKKFIGVVQQKPNLDYWLTAKEILLYHAAYFGVDRADRIKRAAELLARFQLLERQNSMVRGFSGGMMQRLAIARAMMHDPAVLFLDEPSTGLDPQTRILLWEIIREYRERGKTILLTTHNMEEADALCDRLAIIDHGKIIALGTPGELKNSLPGGYLLELRFSVLPEGLNEQLRSLPGVSEAIVNGLTIRVYAQSGQQIVPAILALTSKAGIELQDLHVSEPSLENLFLHHTGRSLRQ